MDEMPLHLIPAIGRTWGERGADNVESSGGKDKRQMTGTPWISFEDEIVFFHTTTMKGKTDCCIPSKGFQKEKSSTNL